MKEMKKQLRVEGKGGIISVEVKMLFTLATREVWKLQAIIW